MAAQENKWEKRGNTFYFRSEPIFTLTWDLQSISDKIFHTKINGQHNLLNNLIATKAIANELQKVVTSYYELALAQKKWELSNTFVKISASRLEIEEKKFKLGFVPKINYLNADLALKEANLSLLEQQQTLKEKRRNLNLMLGKPLSEETLVASNIPVEPIWDISSVTKRKVVNLEAAIQEKKVAIASTELTRAKAYLLSCLSLSTGLFSNGYAYNLKDKIWSNSPSSQFMKIWITIDLGSLLCMPAEIKKARIALNSEKFKLSKEKLSAEDHVKNQKWLYRHALGLHKIASERLKVSNQKLAFVKEAYALDQVKLLELQEAEEDMQKSKINLIAYAFKVKQAEFALYRLVGMFDK
ncbi:TolC family protein [Candidatus Cardinium sp. TP]|nr:TolC family protein [Candidatus Cardinium sp. TP]